MTQQSPKKLTTGTVRRTLTRAQSRRTRRFQITIHIPRIITILGVDIIQQSLTAGDSIADLAHEAHLVQRTARAGDGFDAGVVEGAGDPAGGEVGIFDGVDDGRCDGEEV